MDLTSIAATAISTMGTIGVAIIGYYQYQARITAARHKEESDKQEDLRCEGQLIQLEMLQASIKLSKVTAKAVLGGTPNGEVEEAAQWVQRVEIKFADYMRRACQEV